MLDKWTVEEILADYMNASTPQARSGAKRRLQNELKKTCPLLVGDLDAVTQYVQAKTAKERESAIKLLQMELDSQRFRVGQPIGKGVTLDDLPVGIKLGWTDNDFIWGWCGDRWIRDGEPLAPLNLAHSVDASLVVVSVPWE